MIIERTGKMLIVKDQPRQVSSNKTVIYQRIMIPVSNLQTIMLRVDQVFMILYSCNHIQPGFRLLSGVDQRQVISCRSKYPYKRLAIYDIIKIIRLWPTG